MTVLTVSCSVHMTATVLGVDYGKPLKSPETTQMGNFCYSFDSSHLRTACTQKEAPGGHFYSP